MLDKLSVIRIQGLSIKQLLHLLLHTLRDTDVSGDKVLRLAGLVGLGHESIGKSSDRHMRKENRLPRCIAKRVQDHRIAIRSATNWCTRKDKRDQGRRR